MSRSETKKRPRSKGDAFEIESPDKKNRLISETALACREIPPREQTRFLVSFQSFLEFYTGSPPIHESTKRGEHELDLRDHSVRLGVCPVTLCEPSLANFSHTRMSVSELEESSTSN